jgi:hypothetical protein
MRWLWNGVGIVSFLPATLIVAAWIFAQSASFTIQHNRNHHMWLVTTSTDSLAMRWISNSRKLGSGLWAGLSGRASAVDYPRNQYVYPFDFLGFRISSVFDNPLLGRRSRLITVPYWFLLLAFLIPPFLWTRDFRRSRRREFRRAKGLCLHCGYDLRSSAHRCPECGSPNEMTVTTA